MYKYIFLLLAVVKFNVVSAQQSSYSDPAAAYLRILIEKSGQGTYQQVGNFKVIGTSYLFGPKLSGNIYTPTERGFAVLLSYNTYNQQLEIYQDGNENGLMKKASEVDSFRLLASLKTEFKEDLKFVSSLLLDSSAKKFFAQQVATGNRFSLYKAYKSNLGIVSTNYVNSELRQFDLEYIYYYTDAAKPGLKKLKVNANSLKKEFNDIADISTFANSDEFTTDPEYTLKKIFAALNAK